VQVVIQAGSNDPTAGAWILDAATTSTGLTSITFQGGRRQQLGGGRLPQRRAADNDQYRNDHARLDLVQWD
jgi:hypothetical protein